PREVARIFMSRPSNLSPDNILRFLQVRSGPASADDIISGLHLRKSDRRPLYKMLSKLKKRSAITEVPGGRYRLGRKGQGEDRPRNPAATAEAKRDGGAAIVATPAFASKVLANQVGLPRDQASGRLVLHHDGYGFVVLDTPNPQIDGDIFIPRDAIEDAMHGDRVVVTIPRASTVAPDEG